MFDAIQTVREQWAGLRLELLVPAELTDAQIEAVVAARQMPGKEQLLIEAPFTIARLKDPDACSVKDWARRQTTDLSIARTSDSFLDRTVACFQADIKALHAVLFARKCDPMNGSDGRGGFYTRTLSEHLHIDLKSSEELNALYIVRIAGLPFEYISGRRAAAANQGERELIARAGGHDEIGAQSRQELRDCSILRRYPINEVAFLAACRGGTLHCSSEVPESGGHSMHLRDFRRTISPRP